MLQTVCYKRLKLVPVFNSAWFIVLGLEEWLNLLMTSLFKKREVVCWNASKKYNTRWWRITIQLFLIRNFIANFTKIKCHNFTIFEFRSKELFYLVYCLLMISTKMHRMIPWKVYFSHLLLCSILKSNSLLM